MLGSHANLAGVIGRVISDSRTALKRVQVSSVFRLSKAITKHSKYGLTVLVLPSCLVKTDLTIHLDIPRNPGPKRAGNAAGRYPNNRLQNLHSRSLNLIKYSRSELSHLTSRRISEVPQVSFLGWMLQPATSVKDLGVTLDPHLTYDYHITHVVSSCFSKLYQINRVKKSFIKETLKLLIASLVFSKMLYCSTVWSITSAGNVSKLQSIQNFASQIITNSKKFDHVTPLPVKQ